jgi:hypothetical protein
MAATSALRPGGVLGVVASRPTYPRSLVNKPRKSTKLRTLELKKETLVTLQLELLPQVAGGNNSTRLSQCPTLCFT